jgi:hypothetical protein
VVKDVTRRTVECFGRVAGIDETRVAKEIFKSRRWGHAVT